LGCRGSVEPPALGSCPGPVELQVSGGSTPIFTWQPACPMSALVITTNPSDPGAGSAALVWEVSQTDDANRITPPVRFGIAPPSERSLPNPAAPLQTGATYRFSLYYRGTLGGDLIAVETILTP